MTWVKFIKMLIEEVRHRSKYIMIPSIIFLKYNSVSRMHIYKEKIQVTMVVIFVERNECD